MHHVCILGAARSTEQQSKQANDFMLFVSLLKDSAQEQLLNAGLSLPQTSRPCTMPTSSTCMQEGTNMGRRRQSSISVVYPD